MFRLPIVATTGYEAEPRITEYEKALARAFAELVDWIKANLGAPLTVEMLAERAPP